MLTAPAMLLIATALGVSNVSAEELETPGVASGEPAADYTEGTAYEAETAPGTGPGNPLYDRLFEEQAAGPLPEAEATLTLPAVPPWAWILGMTCLGALVWNRQRQKKTETRQGQVEVLGHTRLGTKSRLTIIRVQGEDGRTRRLLVSSGEGAPSLVADLGSEDRAAAEDLVESLTSPRLPTQTTTFSQELELAETTDVDHFGSDILEDDELDPEDEIGLGLVPPPKVPVWNEAPEENAVSGEPPVSPTPVAILQAPVAILQAPEQEEEPHPAGPLDALEDLLGDVDAPEMVLDVSWDPESGWSGLSPVEAPNEAPAEESKPRPRDEDLIEDEADSWESMMADQTSRRRPALSSASARPSSQAAFDALLHGRRGTSATDGEAPSPKRVRPAVTTVRPLRPWQDAPRMRTPYDRATPPRPDELDASPDIQEPRSAGDVHNLVVEVLQERDDSPEPSPKSNGVVEIARYLRSRVAR